MQAFDAKTHLSALLDRVAKGERITITRRGIPAAMLVPIQDVAGKLTHEEIVEGMRELRKRVKPDRMRNSPRSLRSAASLLHYAFPRPASSRAARGGPA
jgi:prevent-host-death family protein